MSDKLIRGFKSKDEFVKSMSNSSAFQNIDSDILSVKLGEVYDLVVPPKDEAAKEGDAKKKATAVKEADK
jgi:hypothetical protein